jgi:hypothetical protein
MRPITDKQITEEIRIHIAGEDLEKADPFPVNTYRQLVEQVAKLAYLNKDYLLFFRGQSLDFKNRSGASTFYPSIYRGDYLTERELKERFRILEHAARSIRELFAKNNVEGEDELRWKRYVQWSILQHYEICATPLLDFTHSLRVACSFAQLDPKSPNAFVYVFGLPYVMNRISHNSEHDIVNVRLLSICPPDALRPYFQEGYLAGTEDILSEYDRKTDLDFNRRLIAKFQIPTERNFWGRGFSKIPKSVLYPKNDRIEKLCRSIEIDVQTGLLPGDLGRFLQVWNELEFLLIDKAKYIEPRMFTVREAIDRLAKESIINPKVAYSLHELRTFRNRVVHEPKRIEQIELENRIDQIEQLTLQLKQAA